MTYAKTLIEYKKVTFEGASTAKDLEDDWGVQFRKIAGANTFATSYFYSSQNSTLAQFSRLQYEMAESGFELTQIGPISFERQSWPKTSWARMEYTVRKM